MPSAYCIICQAFHPCDPELGGFHEYAQDVPPRSTNIKWSDLEALLEAGLAKVEPIEIEC